jgi:hypothetical protein
MNELLEIYETEWEGKPTYTIVVKKNEVVVKALKFIDPLTNEVVWVNRVELAWHHPDKEYVEGILNEIKKGDNYA